MVKDLKELVANTNMEFYLIREEDYLDGHLLTFKTLDIVDKYTFINIGLVLQLLETIYLCVEFDSFDDHILTVFVSNNEEDKW